MENKVTTVQSINRKMEEPIDLARKYLSIVFILNNIHITKRKLDLVSFIAVNGINSVTAKSNFCKNYHSSKATISNMISELYESKILVKESGKVKLNPLLSLNFDNNLSLKIHLFFDAHR